MSSIEERIVSLLDVAQKRGADGWRRRAIRGCAGVVMVFLAAALTPTTTAADAQQTESPIAADSPTALETSLAFLLSQRDEESGAWKANAGYKLNNEWRVIRRDVPHVGTTALALEALVLGGQWKRETIPGSRAAIRKARQFLLSHQDTEGYIRSAGTRLRSHAYALSALARLARVDSSAELVQAVRLGLRFSLEARSDEAPGWYFEPLSKEADLIETAYQMQAIEAAAETLESAGDVESLKLRIDVIKTREAVAGFARAASVTGDAGVAGYRRQVPARNGAPLPPATYRASAAGLWIERDWLGGGAPELGSVLDSLTLFREARDRQYAGLHFMALDAEMMLARLSPGTKGSALPRGIGDGLASSAIDLLASTRSQTGEFWASVGAGASLSQAASCLILAQVDPDSQGFFTVDMVDADGAKTAIEATSDMTVFDAVLQVNRPSWLNDRTQALELTRRSSAGDDLLLTIDLEAIYRGDTTTNYKLRRGDTVQQVRKKL